MSNLAQDLQAPNIKTKFNPEFPGWTWSFYSQCECTEATSLEYFSSEKDAIADALKKWECDRQQRIAWTILENALSTAKAMGVNSYNFMQGLGWLCFKTPALEVATGHIEKAAYAVEGITPLSVEDIQEIAQRGAGS